MATNRQLAILNLTEELSQELMDYFASRKIEIFTPDSQEEAKEWTHIIIKDVNDFDPLNLAYDLIKNEIHLISLSKPQDLQNFTVNNGNLVLDDCWFQGQMGAFIMDKYLQGYGGITLGDNYPTFQEVGSFNVANPFNTGEYLDRMVQKAFEENLEALSIKTYFDHLIMYISGLKKKGKAGLPLEVTYGKFEDVFAVQVHFYSKQIDIMDFATSLSSSITKKAEEYFLNTAVQSADFFDFSYIPEVNKVIVTGLWTKDERIKFENRGFMFATLSGGVSLAQYEPGEASSSFVVNGSPIEDFSDKVTIPSSLPEEETSQVISGGEVTPDESQLVKGGTELEELVQTISGKMDEDKTVYKIGGQKLDVDKTVFKLSSSVDESAKEKNMQIRNLGQPLQESIKTGLFDFAKALGKDVEDVNDEELKRFQLQKIPGIIQAELENSLAVKSLPTTNARPSSPDELVKALEANLRTSQTENETLKTQLKAMSSEVKILKESRAKIAELQAKAKAALSAQDLKVNSVVENERNELHESLSHKLATEELQKVTVLMDTVKQEELKVRKMQLEAIQKDTVFSQQIEKSERDVKSRDLILMKTKETFTKIVEKKEKEIGELRFKVDQLSKALTSGPSTSQQQQMKDLDKQNQNLNRQIEMYKAKITSLATNLKPDKSEDNLKEEMRKLQMLNQQMKNQLEASKREAEKLQNKINLDNTVMTTLKQEKSNLDQLLKKAMQDAKESAAQVQDNKNDPELKRLQAQNQLLETQVKDSAQKISAMEQKLAEMLKNQKSGANNEDATSKVKVTQLENSVKKLTQDLIEARNQVAEAKKDTNKLRQEKTALQNQLDKMKKEAEKAKAASKKSGGKAA